MLKNYFKTVLRFLKQNRFFAIINAIGLSMALAASFCILLYVINELSYNRCHKNRPRVYRVLNYYNDFKSTDTNTPFILAETLKKEYPQIEKAARVMRIRGFRLKVKNELIDVKDAKGTDSDIFSIFTIPLIMGSMQQNLLEDMNSIVISRDLANKILPNENPIGKEIVGVLDTEEINFIIKGVFEDLPENSTFRAECFINSKWTVDPVKKVFDDNSWRHNWWSTWILVSKKSNSKSLENQFKSFELKYLGEKPDNHYSLQNLSNVYLGSGELWNAGIKGNINNVKLFSAIAILILLVATINYIILSTAVSTVRIKEIGIRKTYGAGNRNIKNQLLGESVLLALIVLPVSLILMSLAMPMAGNLFQTQLHIIKSNIIVYISVYLTLTVLIGLASGIYISVFLSRLKVLDIFRNASLKSKKRIFLRSLLIVFQLVIFCSFVSSVLIIRSQYKFVLRKDPGYYNSDILFIDLGNEFKAYSLFINNIKSNPNVIMASGLMEGLPMSGGMSYLVPSFENKEIKVNLEVLPVDYNFIKTMGMTLTEGREFSEEFGSDPAQSVLLNETAVKQLGIISPLGKKMGNRVIIGVVKDFNLHSLRSDIGPLEIDMMQGYVDQIVVHYKHGTLKSILPVIESEWSKVAPDRSFKFKTIENVITNLYSSEKNLIKVISVFTLLVFIISSCGLFGITLFIAKSRTKEIGIKKIFGSSERLIVLTFLQENFILVTIASLLSVPLTIHFMTQWLNRFAFKISISWWIFLFAYLSATIVVLLTVFYHSYKASLINPLEALRYE
jgi:putative ABC transport system permease protein